MSLPFEPDSDAVGVFSRGILVIPFLSAFLERRVVPLKRSQGDDWNVSDHSRRVSAIVGWGRRPTARHSISFAIKWGLPYVALEDGFLRSFGTGEHFPPLSLIKDDCGIYYDSTRPSALERLLASTTDVLENIDVDVARARALVLQHRLSKYNHAPVFDVAMLRLKQVVVYGQPFYAGWGLTTDVLKEGVAFASGALHRLRVGFIRRQWRKVHGLTRAMALS